MCLYLIGMNTGNLMRHSFSQGWQFDTHSSLFWWLPLLMTMMTMTTLMTTSKMMMTIMVTAGDEVESRQGWPVAAATPAKPLGSFWAQLHCCYQYTQLVNSTVAANTPATSQLLEQDHSRPTLAQHQHNVSMESFQLVATTLSTDTTNTNTKCLWGHSEINYNWWQVSWLPMISTHHQ